jgi:hypothetical protein
LGGATIQVLRSWYSREHEKLLLKLLLLVNYLYYAITMHHNNRLVSP